MKDANRKAMFANMKPLHDDARINWDNWSVGQKKHYFNQTTLPTNETFDTIYKGRHIGKLPVRVGADGAGNGIYRYVGLPDGSHLNLDVKVLPEFRKCWKCKKLYNAYKSNGSCPHCGIDV